MTALPESVLTKNQKKMFGPKEIGEKEIMTVVVRYDDECGNGHNSFGITASIRGPHGESGGCQHDEVRKHFPELAKYIKWHLCSSDGPMHYLENTRYHASNKDCWGRTKGQPYRFKTRVYFDRSPIPFTTTNKAFIALIDELGSDGDWASQRVEAVDYEGDSRYTLSSVPCSSYFHAPFKTQQAAQDFLKAMRECDVRIEKVPTAYGEGKEPDLEAAQHSAIWPEATLEQLQSREGLEERLPGLLEGFKADMEELGFVY